VTADPPSTPDPERRTSVVSVRVAPWERILLDMARSCDGASLSDFMRDSAVGVARRVLAATADEGM
jgi:uncharacterized protein (DUF1778 family)